MLLYHSPFVKIVVSYNIALSNVFGLAIIARAVLSCVISKINDRISLFHVNKRLTANHMCDTVGRFYEQYINSKSLKLFRD